MQYLEDRLIFYFLRSYNLSPRDFFNTIVFLKTIVTSLSDWSTSYSHYIAGTPAGTGARWWSVSRYNNTSRQSVSKRESEEPVSATRLIDRISREISNRSRLLTRSSEGRNVRFHECVCQIILYVKRVLPLSTKPEADLNRTHRFVQEFLNLSSTHYVRGTIRLVIDRSVIAGVSTSSSLHRLFKGHLEKSWVLSELIYLMLYVACADQVSFMANVSSRDLYAECLEERNDDVVIRLFLLYLIMELIFNSTTLQFF